MNKKLVSLSFTNDELSAIESTVAQLESQLGGLVSLTIDQRKTATKMGAKSEQFCRETIRMIEQNPTLMPAATDWGNAPADLVMLDHVKDITRRLQRLTERSRDTEFGMSSDVMVTSLSAYGQLKLAGHHLGLVGLRQAIGGRFARRSRKATETPPQAVAVNTPAQPA